MRPVVAETVEVDFTPPSVLEAAGKLADAATSYKKSLELRSDWWLERRVRKLEARAAAAAEAEAAAEHSRMAEEQARAVEEQAKAAELERQEKEREREAEKISSNDSMGGMVPSSSQ